ncbi:MAG: hypothetical protein HZB29_11970 [Nitrospinae bacterium]|nr:hypothetical protein [Nitrospinota bacterium]
MTMKTQLETCPACEGEGYDKESAAQDDTERDLKPCYLCNGKGLVKWIEAETDEEDAWLG